MRNQAMLVCILAALPAAACLGQAEEDLTTDEAAALSEDLALESLDLAAEAPEVAAAAAAAAVPAAPSLFHEYLGCSGTAARYLISWRSSGSPRYDVDYRRGSAAYGAFYNGTATSQFFATSSITSVSFRARACNTSGCSAFRTISFTPVACRGGDPL